MFIKPCKLLKSIGFPLLTGTWTSRPLVLSKVTLGLVSGLVSSLTSPSLLYNLGLSLVTFTTSPSVLGFLTIPSEVLTVALGFLFFSNISSLASIADWKALISSICLGKTFSISETSFFCCKLDFLHSITASDLWPVCSLINCGSTPFLKSLVQVDFLIEWFLKFPSTAPLHHVFNVAP